MGTVLTVTIPLVIVAYAVYLVIHLHRQKKLHPGCGCGCSGCPMSGVCHDVEKMRQGNTAGERKGGGNAR